MRILVSFEERVNHCPLFSQVQMAVIFVDEKEFEMVAQSLQDDRRRVLIGFWYGDRAERRKSNRGGF